MRIRPPPRMPPRAAPVSRVPPARLPSSRTYACAFLRALQVATDRRGDLVAVEVVDVDVRLVSREHGLQAQRAGFAELPGDAERRFTVDVAAAHILGAARAQVLVAPVDAAQATEGLQLRVDRVLEV